MDCQIDIQDQTKAFEEEEEEETLSLSDFPIGTTTCDSLPSREVRRSSSSEPTDFFEFFSSDDLSCDMSNAEDIIFHGKLVPFKEPPQIHNIDEKRQSFHHRRSGSLSELKSTCTDESVVSSKSRIMRSCRSLDYRKLRRFPSSAASEPPEINRNSSMRSSGRYDSSNQKESKPRWYVFMLGLAKFPLEMELKDIKSRQVRRTPATMFPSFDGGGRSDPVKHNNRKRSWDLLRVLSCKGPLSVAVSTGFGLMPQACHASYS